ncbi:MAG: GDP-L-fucose synthase [Gammaproteobacteria bacterium]|nr:GDP-L-fucose synthase [Gammaproteobacteria bacterium]MBT4548845.1 GDP-L-fucose synthase [Gammaproteobacteria bacterium]
MFLLKKPVKDYFPLTPLNSYVFDTTKPDGTPRKLIDVSRLSAMGWRYSVDLELGLRKTYDWFLEQEVVRG